MVSQVAALEYGEQGIRVNAISPGLTDTPLTAPMQATPGVREAYLERIPLKRVGTPDDMASAALYLASDDASYISGVNLVVDGAWEQTGYPDLRPFRSGMMAARQPSAG
jgi:NAD(P)-dependent dehydrogenase (short-subunit alcohol dehydrogenase family)